MNLLVEFDTRFPGPVLGADEVGNGAWAGPCHVCAAILPNDRQIITALADAGLNDSKKLSHSSRERLFAAMEEHCVWYSVRFRSSVDIDRLGLGPCLNALYEEVLYDAMRGPAPVSRLIDGSWRPLPWNPTFIKQGDGRSLTIAAASVIAKVHRDRMMDDLAVQYPGYDFHQSVGYGTTKHAEALRRLGPCPLHRRSVRPVRAAIAARASLREGAPGT